MSAADHRLTARLACLVVLWAALGATVPLPSGHASPAVTISSGSEQFLASMLTATDPDSGADLISRQFLGIPYGANTLAGSTTQPEQLVVELQRVDCFTYADYVEALKRADSPDEFIAALVDVRYKDGVVAFENRKHFFTDWSAASPPIAADVTARLSGDAVTTTKNLNRRDSGGVYLPGLPVVARTVTFIPSDRVSSEVVAGLRTGDYLGAYAEDGGLDVTHVGIVIETPGGPVFRNASSLSADDAVVDTPLHDYLATVPGIVVLRPLV
ncbi:DUF1460 domain-containing protein [Mycolicibacterium austroafricanum]|uniref:DUF1460 domain-containing protein n=1 Tax=Mycolicibacterium austroafricanum TaxID=39687 RepID=UPI003AF3C91D